MAVSSRTTTAKKVARQEAFRAHPPEAHVLHNSFDNHDFRIHEKRLPIAPLVQPEQKVPLVFSEGFSHNIRFRRMKLLSIHHHTGHRTEKQPGGTDDPLRGDRPPDHARHAQRNRPLPDTRRALDNRAQRRADFAVSEVAQGMHSSVERGPPREVVAISRECVRCLTCEVRKVANKAQTCRTIYLDYMSLILPSVARIASIFF